MIWIKWGIQTAIVVLIIILGMIYGWGLVPKRWSIVIICYLIANALLPLCAFINHKLTEKMGWEISIPQGYHVHKNPKGGGRKKKLINDQA